jgi:hypothetical protein
MGDSHIMFSALPADDTGAAEPASYFDSGPAWRSCLAWAITSWRGF